MGRPRKENCLKRYTVMLDPEAIKKLEEIALKTGIVKGIYLRKVLEEKINEDFKEKSIDMVKTKE